MREYREEFDVVGFTHAQLDLAGFDQVREKLDTIDFDVLVNAAAFTNVDLCEKERDQAFRINAEAPRILAEICRDKKAKLIHFSTDYVFDGENHQPYTENDPANPISVYGESKRAGEKFVLQTADRHLIVRVSWVILSIIAGAVVFGIVAYAVAWLIIPAPRVVTLHTSPSTT